MKYLVVGHDRQIQEFLAMNHSGMEISTSPSVPGNVASYDVVFDLSFDEDPHRLTAYQGAVNTVLVAGAAGQSLAQALHRSNVNEPPQLIGMNSLPTFINRSMLEWSTLDATARDKGIEIAASLDRPVEWVADRVGMVTPRIVLMLINEACYTLQEGTATREDIDKGMKLGTNYPMGPFEWADEIGITHVYRVLQALLEDTGDERYKVAPLLKQHYLLNRPFYG